MPDIPTHEHPLGLTFCYPGVCLLVVILQAQVLALQHAVRQLGVATNLEQSTVEYLNTAWALCDAFARVEQRPQQ